MAKSTHMPDICRQGASTMAERFAAVRAAPLATQVAEHLRARIAEGQWQVGSRIPGETQLAAEFEVSRGTIREALRALTMAGLLEPRVGDGTYVHAKDELSVLLNQQVPGSNSLAHALEVRVILESGAATLAAQAASADDIASLRVALARRHEASEAQAVQAYVDADAVFHRTVIAASRNPLLLRLYDALGHVVEDSILQSTLLPEDPHLEQAHVDMVEAIERGISGDAAAAAQALNQEARFLASIDREEP